MRSLLPLVAGAVLGTVGSVGDVAAQSREPDAAIERAPSLWEPASAWSRAPESPARPELATALSAAVPGTGQLYLGRKRGWGYLALEAVGWVAYLNRSGRGSDFRDRYRDFAWQEARIQSEARVDAGWAYYETLTHWTRSGLFDVDPGVAGIQPETDATTYNGSIWSLATGIYDVPAGTPESNPRYVSALGYYLERAYGSAYLWDWTDTGTARDEYADLIHESDSGYRQARHVLGAIIAHHVVSAVDAFLTARGMAPPLEVSVTPTAPGVGPGWTLGLRVPNPLGVLPGQRR